MKTSIAMVVGALTLALALTRPCQAQDGSYGHGDGLPIPVTVPGGAGPVADPVPGASASASDTVADAYFAQAARLYATPPALAGCQPGRLTDATRQGVVDTLNAMRALHGLAAVGLDPAADAGAAQGALMLAANGQLSHTPPPGWTCYTAAGAAALGTSNIYGGTTSAYLSYQAPDDDLAAWLADAGNVIAGNIGHRRWLLDPFLARVAYGRADAQTATGETTSGAVLKTIGEDRQGPVDTPEVIAYPIHDYPARLYPAGALFSVAVVHDASDIFANADVDFSAARIEMRARDGDGGLVPISRVAFDNLGFGVPNNLQFLPASVVPGTVYDITLDNVVFGGTAHAYHYWVRITSG